MVTDEIQAAEAAISACVHTFYARARKDELLGPSFEATVHDWDDHLAIVCDFWSGVLLKTKRYSGHPYTVHVPLQIEPVHIERWLELFVDAAQTTLPRPYAEAAIARARRMGESFKVGLFPFVDSQGRPSKHPG